MKGGPVVPVGRSVSVEVPATSANLGPGFDSLGLALDWYDRSTVTVIPEGVEIIVSGEGEDTVPRDSSHLVVATIMEALGSWNVRVPGIRLEAVNTIPHGSGLGSSSAALVGGLLMAWGLARPGEPVDRIWLLREAVAREGHGDNVGPAIHGGFVITWGDGPGEGADAGLRSRPSQIHPDVCAVAFVPKFEVLTSNARAVLGEDVPFADAIANISRAALLVHAMAEEPSLFLEATADRLHQDQRGPLMPASKALVEALRSEGLGAFISGAGPTVLVLADQAELPFLLRVAGTMPAANGFEIRKLGPGAPARILEAR